MVASFPIAWEAEDAQRFVGKLTLGPEQLELNGTAPEPSRPRRVVIIQRNHVQSAQVERRQEWPSVTITTKHTVYQVEILAGGRGAALSLVNDLS